MATLVQRHEPPTSYASMYSIFQRGRTDAHEQPEQSTLESRQHVKADNSAHQVEEDASPSSASSRAQPTTPSGRKRRKISAGIDSQPPSSPVIYAHDRGHSTPAEKHAVAPVTLFAPQSTPTGNVIFPSEESSSTQSVEQATKIPEAENALVLPAGPVSADGQQALPERKMLTLKLGKNGKLKQISPNPTRASPRTRSTLSNLPIPPPAEPKNKRLKVRNGKLTKSLVVCIKYCDRSKDVQRLGDKITNILSRPPAPPKTTHPFFTTKLRPQNQDHSQPSSAAETSDVLQTNGIAHVAPSKPIAWSDIVFKSKRPATSTGLQPQRPIWPPRELQHVGIERSIEPTRTLKAAEKQTMRSPSTQIEYDRAAIARHLLPNIHSISQGYSEAASPCKLRFVPGSQVVTQLDSASSGELLPASLRVRDRITHGTSYFDRAEAAGPLMWTQQYAPTCWEEVLQPAAQTLHDWLKTLAVHNVKQGLDNPLLKQMLKPKKRGRKPKDELDDFIVDDEDEIPFKAPKNAILLVGPNGCGKTAAVFAAAKQLNFEVFEIHAGENRSQKDIFDRVGNMTQNHLVRTGQQDSRGSSLAPDDPEALSHSQQDTQKTATTRFFTPFQSCPTRSGSRPSTPQPGKKEQKQSLILLEEVDNVFDEDKSFWTGVQSLVQKSKRPVVMTCNDITNIPRDELDLHQILYCDPPDVDATVDYLTYVAAAEGHVLPRSALHRLYLSTGRDLRAALTQLNFWCQMTVGSVRGGLDWYVSQPQAVRDGFAPRHRVFSEATYRDDLDTIPGHTSDLETVLSYSQLCLDVKPSSLDISAFHPDADLAQAIDSVLDHSDSDLLDFSAQPIIYSKMLRSFDYRSVRDAVSNYRIRARQHAKDVRAIALAAFEPLMDEPAVFPPSQGRLAPSIDCSRTSVIVDVAPFVRAIAAFDQRLEQQRDELFSSQGKKSRNTRAARAAAEGGDKATSRRERWFSKDLNMNAVMSTGGAWPEWSAVSEEGDQDPGTPEQSSTSLTPQS